MSESDVREFVNSLADDELMILLELAFQVYQDGNDYEWFKNIIDLSDEVVDPIFEKVVKLMGKVPLREGRDGRSKVQDTLGDTPQGDAAGDR
jgi:hypothetical protein